MLTFTHSSCHSRIFPLTAINNSLHLLPLQADSHIACRSHATPMPFPCHAMPLRVYNVSFPFDLHSAAVSDSHLPCRAHAIPDHAVLLKATAQHGCRETACGLLARVRLLPATTRSFTKVVTRRIPISDAGGQCEIKHRLSWTRKRVVTAHYKKEDLLHCWTSSSDISVYNPDFHEGHSTVGEGRGMAGERNACGTGTACYV